MPELSPLERTLQSWLTEPENNLTKQSITIDGLRERSDVSAQLGTKTASYTSWRCYGQSLSFSLARHVSGATVAEGKTISQTTEKFPTDEPNALEIPRMSTTQMAKIKNGKAHFIRGKGYMLSKDASKLHLQMLSDKKTWLTEMMSYISQVCTKDGRSAFFDKLATTHKMTLGSDPAIIVEDVTTGGLKIVKQSEYDEKNTNTRSLSDEPVQSMSFTNSESSNTTGRVESVVPFLPIRVCELKEFPLNADGTSDVAMSPIFNAYVNRQSDPTVGALGSVVRAPNIIDSSTILELVKVYSQQGGAMTEEAAPTNLLNMFNAIDYNSIMYDPEFLRTPFRTIEPKSKDLVGPFIKSPFVAYETKTKVVCITLSAFLRFVNGDFKFTTNAEGTDQLSWRDIENEWAVVPVSIKNISRACILFYIVSFLHSKYHNLTVSYIRRILFAGKDSYIQTIPASNTVVMDNPVNALVVLTDADANFTTATFNNDGITLNVLRGPANLYDMSTDLADWWESRWCTDNINSAPLLIVEAFNLFCERYNVNDNIGRAINFAAVFNTKTAPGLLVGVNEEEKYNYSDVGGAWTVEGDNIPTIPGTNIKLKFCTTQQIPQLLSASNTAGFDALQITPSSFQEMKQADSNNERFLVQVDGLTFGLPMTGVRSEKIPQYSLRTTRYFNRIIVQMDLAVSNPRYLGFTAGGLSTTIRQRSMLLTSISSLYLTNAPFSLRAWDGYPQNDQNTPGSYVVDDIKFRVTKGFLLNPDVETQLLESNIFSFSEIEMAYNVDYESLDYLSYSPCPNHLTIQGAQLVGYSDTQTQPETTYQWDHSIIPGVPFENAGINKLKIFCSRDDALYEPMIKYITSMGKGIAKKWIDYWSWLSEKSPVTTISRARTETNSVAININPDIRAYKHPSPIFVTSSAFEKANKDFWRVTITDFEQLPPPPKNEAPSSSKMSEEEKKEE
nr:MAG: coat protein [Totiviridae sp. 1]